MSLSCYVHQKDGTRCTWGSYGGPDVTVEGLATLVTHLMEHISALAERAPDFYKCPEHGTKRVYRQGTDEFGWRGYCGTCGEQLEKEPI